jgi:hypothetical protein
MPRPGAWWSRRSPRRRARGCSPRRAPRRCCACPRGTPRTTRSAPPPRAARPPSLRSGTNARCLKARMPPHPGSTRGLKSCVRAERVAHAQGRRAGRDGGHDVRVVHDGGDIRCARARQLQRHAGWARDRQARRLCELWRGVAEPVRAQAETLDAPLHVLSPAAADRHPSLRARTLRPSHAQRDAGAQNKQQAPVRPSRRRARTSW